VAVVAVAHKLALLAWHLLKTNEPYRYALPRATEDKLAKLRVAATGDKRRTGPAKGKKATAKLPRGSRTIKSLPQVLASEGVPAASPAPAGEQRHVAGLKLDGFVSDLQQPKVISRRAKPKEDEAPDQST
jgi:hypothetical protein